MDKKDIEILSNEAIPESIRVAIAQSLISSASAVQDRNVELQQIKLEREKTLWNTPFVAALAGFITLTSTFVFDRLTTQTNADIASLVEERKFQYEIVRNELADDTKSNVERADVLLFLARAGILNTLNESELRSMATEQKNNPETDILPRLTRPSLSTFINDPRFRSRGYIMITGENNYSFWGDKIGYDLISNPGLAAQPDVAAKLLVQYMIDRGVKKFLDDNDYIGARKAFAASPLGANEVNSKTQLYLGALKKLSPTSNSLQISGLSNDEWITVHVPEILKAIRKAQIADPNFQAYILATADFETAQGRHMEAIER